MMYSRPTRRVVLKSAVAGTAAALAAPYVSAAYAAGRLTLGCWDHRVPGALVEHMHLIDPQTDRVP